MADDVTTTMGMTFRAFTVPNFVSLSMPARPKQEGMHPLPSLAIQDLSPDALDALAARWLDNLYASCKRPSPFILKVLPYDRG